MVNKTLHERYNNDPEKLFDHIYGQLMKKKAIKSEREKANFKKWFMLRIKHQIKFDYILIWQCYQIWKRLSKNNDATIVITGATGTGKSTLAMNIMCWIIPDFDRKNIITTLIKYMDIFIERAMHIRAMMRRTNDIYRAPPGGLIMDEGNELRSDESMKKANRQFRRMYTIQRFCKLLLIITIPKWHHLDKALRDSDSTDLLIYISRHGHYKGIIGKGIDVVEERNRKNITGTKLSTEYFWHGYCGEKIPESIGQFNYEFGKIDSACEEMVRLRDELVDCKKKDMEEAKAENSDLPALARD